MGGGFVCVLVIILITVIKHSDQSNQGQKVYSDSQSEAQSITAGKAEQQEYETAGLFPPGSSQ